MLACNHKFFRIGEVSWNYGTSINISSKSQEKKAPHGNILEFFLLNSLKTKLWMENLTQRCTWLGPFLSKIKSLFFNFEKSRGKAPLSPQVVHLWVWLNIHHCPWICLNILGNAWINCSDYARDLNMPDHLTFSTGF